jgi:uridylate kinase
MDGTAIALCKENNLPIVVFNLFDRGNIVRAVKGETVGTLVGGNCEVS